LLPSIRKMIKPITYLLVLTLLISCSWKTERTNSTEEVIPNVSVKSDNIESEISIDNVCKCYNGIGASDKDNPLLIFNFSNGKSVSICGYKDPDLQTENLNISEFNVFDCKSGESYVEYGAMENCILITKKDTLTIQLLKFLPTGENWKWKSVQIAEQVITTDLNKIKVLEINTKYKPTHIENKQQSGFLNSLKQGQGFGNNWEDDLGRLEVLSLVGNEKAWEILKNYETFTGKQTDGAIAEQWKDAVATVGWIIGKE
jgi:hypothetical protein